jgi:hypothetical protein
VTGADTYQASVAIPPMKWLNEKRRYAEAATGNREFFLNKPHKGGDA